MSANSTSLTIRRHTLSESNPSETIGRSRVVSTASQTSASKRRKNMKHSLCFKCVKGIRARYSKPRTRSQSEPVANEESGNTPLLQKVLSPDYSYIRKISWCLITVTCTCVCLWQLGDRIKHYFDAPIMYTVHVARQHEVQFPAITLCPAREPFYETALENTTTPSNFSLDDIWAAYEFKVNDSIFISGACNEDHSNCDFDAGVFTNLITTVSHTFYGNCITVLPGRPMEYRGAATFMELALSPRQCHRQWFGQNIAAQFYFQESGSKHRHEAYYMVEWLKLYEETSVHLTVKQFHFLNASHNLCDDEPTVTECRNRCADKKLDEIVNCSLPFMVSKWPACDTLQKAKKAMNQSREFYQMFSYSQCPCRRQCIEKVYSYNINSAGQRKDQYTTLLLQFADNLVENVTETYAYSFSALVSDIGGGLGFFLGVSILSLFRAFESVVDTFSWKRKV